MQRHPTMLVVSPEIERDNLREIKTKRPKMIPEDREEAITRRSRRKNKTNPLGNTSGLQSLGENRREDMQLPIIPTNIDREAELLAKLNRNNVAPNLSKERQRRTTSSIVGMADNAELSVKTHEDIEEHRDNSPTHGADCEGSPQRLALRV